MIEPVILEETRHIMQFTREREDEFMALVDETFERTSKQELRFAKNELEKAKRRIVELDLIIKRIYEDRSGYSCINERPALRISLGCVSKVKNRKNYASQIKADAKMNKGKETLGKVIKTHRNLTIIFNSHKKSILRDGALCNAHNYNTMGQ